MKKLILALFLISIVAQSLYGTGQKNTTLHQAAAVKDVESVRNLLKKSIKESLAISKLLLISAYKKEAKNPLCRLPIDLIKHIASFIPEKNPSVILKQVLTQKNPDGRIPFACLSKDVFVLKRPRDRYNDHYGYPRCLTDIETSRELIELLNPEETSHIYHKILTQINEERYFLGVKRKNNSPFEHS